MQITGTIEKILPLQTGEGRNGTWVKQDVVINQGGQYPTIVCITFFGTKCTPEGYVVGESVEVEVNAKSNEKDGKYFTNLTAWKMKRTGGSTAPQTTPEQRKEPEPIQSQDTDNLPF